MVLVWTGRIAQRLLHPLGSCSCSGEGGNQSWITLEIKRPGQRGHQVKNEDLKNQFHSILRFPSNLLCVEQGLYQIHLLKSVAIFPVRPCVVSVIKIFPLALSGGRSGSNEERKTGRCYRQVFQPAPPSPPTDASIVSSPPRVVKSAQSIAV